jgi:uncharacterized membrane protein YiaA
VREAISLHQKKLYTFVGMVLLLFLLIVGLTSVWSYITRAPKEAFSMNLFAIGLVVFFIGLMISYDWLGEKPDYSKTSYVSTNRGVGRVYPWPRSKDERTREIAIAKSRVVEEDRQRVLKEAKSKVSVIGVAILLVGLLLMVTSGILA